MTQRITLEAVLQEAGHDTAGRFLCGGCGRDFPAFALAVASDIEGTDEPYLCACCIIDIERARPAPDQPKGWDSEIGQSLKAERARLLDAYSWTMRIDSPLTNQCQKAWAQWAIDLNQMTLNSDPESWAFPNPPDLEYMDPSAAAERLLSHFDRKD